MNVLLIHNRYKQRGGEDAVFEAEGAMLSSYGHAVERLVFDNSSIRSISDKIKAAAGILYNSASRKKLDGCIDAFHPDVMHVHNFVPIASPSVFFAAQAHHIPVIMSIHNFRLICPSATLFYHGKIYEKSIHSVFPLDPIIKGVYHESVLDTAAVELMTATHHLAGTWKNKIDRYIVMTNFAREKFMESSLHIPEHKFVIKPNFVTDNGAGEDVRENFFLFAGRLSEEKGLTILLRAARAKGFNLLVIGDGPLKNEVEEAAGNHQNIHYLGFKPKTDVIHYLKNCKALIFPSVCYEGFPIIILEAFSTGTPVIASRLGSMAEVVTDHFNGLHFEPGDEVDLGRKIDELSIDPGLARELSVNSRSTYLDNFTPEKNYQQLLKIYEDAIVFKRQAAAAGKHAEPEHA